MIKVVEHPIYKDRLKAVTVHSGEKRARGGGGSQQCINLIRECKEYNQSQWCPIKQPRTMGSNLNTEMQCKHNKMFSFLGGQTDTGIVSQQGS